MPPHSGRSSWGVATLVTVALGATSWLSIVLVSVVLDQVARRRPVLYEYLPKGVGLALHFIVEYGYMLAATSLALHVIVGALAVFSPQRSRTLAGIPVGLVLRESLPGDGHSRICAIAL